jgi:acyl-coenzyme A synthetase/AMP-(fatty) acid ligase
MVFYRTGDRVTQLDNGEYAFIGRVDNQIKLRGGYRVELGEIEAVMRRYPGVAEAVALGWPVQDGIVQGVTVFATAAATIDPEAIKMWSRTQLPSYMAVTEIRIEEQLPLNANGKIDRKALRAMLERGSERATD